MNKVKIDKVEKIEDKLDIFQFDNGVEVEGFNPLDFAQEYSEGDMQNVSDDDLLDLDLGESIERNVMLPAHIKLRWFRHVYPNGSWTFSEIVPSLRKDGFAYVTAYVWKEKPAEGMQIGTHDAEAVVAKDLSVEPEAISRIHTLALSKALETLGFTLPLTEKDLSKEARSSLEGTVEEVENEDTKNTSQEKEAVEEVKSEKKAEETKPKVETKSDEKAEVQKEDVKQEEQLTLPDLSDIQIISDPVFPDKEETEVEEDLEEETVVQENEEVEEAPEEASEKVVEIVSEEESDKVDLNEGKTLAKKIAEQREESDKSTAVIDDSLSLEERVELMRKVYKPTPEQAAERVVKLLNPKELPIGELVKTNQGLVTVEFIANSDSYLRSQRDANLLPELIKDKIAAEIQLSSVEK